MSIPTHVEAVLTGELPCRCDALRLVVDPADTGRPQHIAVR
ncbi:hypothetical protein FHX42_002182 [Saccharopolyspora lacisalsi]|uniref:Uncharacterized protein n=1 Tax=Halosaccharopolyspora lacisalsi TaxID=1000566 RepID=A0A839DZJ9_9PSEU|nr:hypothetical protein [Halosaccharopolyspora lacisalsi]MBA8824835.1 hypothetical protein [Halosaccharopolyspora lacisalsi]